MTCKCRATLYTDFAWMLSLRSKVSALWLVGGMALLAGSLRFAFWAANEITLWYLYGAATVKHDHLKILKVKPLTVSNGDVLRGIGAYHYFVSIGIWLPLTLSLVYFIDRLVLPEPCRAILRRTDQSEDHASVVALLFLLPMVILITAVLPTWAALGFAFVTVAGILIVLRKICCSDTVLE